MKKYFYIFFLVIFFGLIGTNVKAAGYGNVTGYAWGGADDGAGIPAGLGWISVSSFNCAGTGMISNGAAGCPVAGTPMVQYGLTVPDGDGNLSGYAWNSNLNTWIAFDNTAGYLNSPTYGTCPSGECSARRVGNKLEGWARIIGIADAIAAGDTSSGYEGWIKLDGGSYGVTIDETSGNFGNYAASSANEFGYIAFGSVNGIGGVRFNRPTLDFSASQTGFEMTTDGAINFPATLTWTSSNASSCMASGAWSGAKAPNVTASENVNLTSSIANFTIECTNGIASVSKTINIQTYCNEHKCQLATAGTCNAVKKWKVLGVSACGGVQQCTINADCNFSPYYDHWEEVAP